MSKNAPDTRNKLDSNKNIKRDSHPKKIKRKPISNPKELKKVFEGDVHATQYEDKKKEKRSKGQIFKSTNGYSKTMKRLMNKYAVTTPDEYKPIRKKRQEAEKKIRQKKHADSTAHKRAHGKKKGSKGSTPATKTKKSK